MSGFCVTSPRLLFTRSWGNKAEINKFTENYGLNQTKKLLCCFAQCQTKNILGKKIGFMSMKELKHDTFLSHGRQPEVSCFPV